MPVNPETGEWIDPPREECERKRKYVSFLFWTWMFLMGAAPVTALIGAAIGGPFVLSLSASLLIYVPLWAFLGGVVSIDLSRNLEAARAQEREARARAAKRAEAERKFQARLATSMESLSRIKAPSP